MPDLACAAAAARTTPLAPIRPAISISTRVIRLPTTPILGSEVPGDFSRVNPLALLRARRDRPRDRRAAEKGDEIATPHCLPSQAEDHGLTIAGQAPASQQKRAAHFRYGSGPDITRRLANVRFAPQSRHTLASVQTFEIAVRCGENPVRRLEGA